MKKLILFALLIITTNVFGQRLFKQVDIKLHIIEPKTFPKIYCPYTINFNYYAINNGPDTILADDRLVTDINFNGYNNDSFFRIKTYFSKTILPGDSQKFTISKTIHNWPKYEDFFSIGLNIAVIGKTINDFDIEPHEKQADNRVAYNNIKIRPVGSASINNENINNSISLYPNPASHFINIELDNKNPIYDYKIINAQGQIIKFENNCNQTKIDISALNNGMYWIIFKHNNQLIKQTLLICKN